MQDVRILRGLTGGWFLFPAEANHLWPNTLLPPPEINPAKEPVQLHAGAELHWTETKEEGILASLWGSVRDVFFPVKLPPLVLESKPIAVVDRMAVKQNPRAWAGSVAVLCAADSVYCVADSQEGAVLGSGEGDVLLTDLSVPPHGAGEGQHDGWWRRPARSDSSDPGDICRSLRIRRLRRPRLRLWNSRRSRCRSRPSRCRRT